MQNRIHDILSQCGDEYSLNYVQKTSEIKLNPTGSKNKRYEFN